MIAVPLALMGLATPLAAALAMSLSSITVSLNCLEGEVMEMLAFLITISLGLGGLGLGAFFWALHARQYEDPMGASQRILSPEFDDQPKG